MDRKIKLLAASSLVVAMASACTPYNARTGTYDNGYAGASQNSQGASQNSQANKNTSTKTNTCAPCRSNSTYSTNTATGKYSQQWYIDRWNRGQNKRTYTPPKRTIYTPPKKTTYQAGGHNQQWYVDRWNRQQQTQQNKPKYTPPKKTYSGYGGAKPYTPPRQTYTPKPYTPPKKPATNYYDYSKAGGYSTSNKQIYSGRSNSASNKSLYTGASRSNTASNKSIYTGSYNNNTYKPYAPKTYTGGANSNIYSGSSSSSSSNSYSSSYGGGEVASGSYKAGDSSYTVRKGDTVFSVMRLTGVYWKDIIKKNSLTAPYTISPGQRLRLK
jgi:hypothetical protein